MPGIKARILTFFTRTLQWLAFVAVSLLLVFALLAVSVNIPAVQTWLVQRVAGYVTEKLNYPISVRFVDIAWFDTLILKDVKVQDRQGKDMIYVKRLKVRFSLEDLLADDVKVKSAVVEGADVLVVNEKATGQVNINSFIDAISAWAGGTESDTTQPGAPFVLAKAHVINSRFRYFDETEPMLAQPFDYYHFTADSVNALVHDFFLHGDTLRLRTDGLTCRERKSQLKVHKLNTVFTSTRHSLEFYHTDCYANNSHVRDSVAFRFNNYSAFQDFYHRITIIARFDSTKLDFDDLYLFAPDLLEGRHERVVLSGNVRGTVADYHSPNLRLWFGQKTYLAGSVAMEGLPNWDRTLISLNLKNSHLHPADLLPYSDANARVVLEKVSYIKPLGTFEGFPSDFTAKGSVESNLGMLYTDVHINLDENPAKTTYVGGLRTRQFDLGGLTGNRDLYQKVSLAGKIKGRGITVASADFDLNAEVESIGINHYNYRNLKGNGHFAHRSSTFNLAIADTSLNGVLGGAINLNPGQESIAFTAQINHSNPQRLNLVPGLQLLNGRFEGDFQGLDPDAFNGEGSATDLELVFDGRHLAAGNLDIDASVLNGVRSLTVSSDLAEAQLEGDFSYERLITDLGQLYKETRLAFTNNVSGNTRAYTNKKFDASPYAAELTVRLKKPHELTRLLMPGLKLAKDARLEGSYTHGSLQVFQVMAHSDTMIYNRHRLYLPDADISISKSINSTNVIAGASFHSKQQVFDGFEATENLRADLAWRDGVISYDLGIVQQDSVNGLDLSGRAQFFADRIENRITRSNLRLLKHQWQIDSANLVVFQAGKAQVENFGIRSDEQYLAVRGTVGAELADSLHVAIDQLSLEPLEILTGQPINGTVNGVVHMAQLLQGADFGGALRIDSLQASGYYIGDLTTAITWDSYRQQPYLNGTLFRNKERAVLLDGYLNFDNTAQQLELNAQLRNTSLVLLQPFLLDIVEDLQGTMSGQVRVTGRFNQPQLSGKVTVARGSVVYPYLGARFLLANQHITIEPTAFIFDDVEVQDPLGNRAEINRGRLTHNNFSDWAADFDIRLNQFQILNTTPTPSSLYYGTVFASGRVRMTGPFDDFYINAVVSSDKGTRISLPLDSETDASDQQFSETGPIRFTDSRKKASVNPEISIFTDSSAHVVQTSRLDLSGVRMDFNLDINNNAEIEIIFDKRAGEVLKSVGHGKMKLAIDTRGELTMIGQYELDRGTYNFTFYDIINKRFDISRGSTITWSGDPLEGIMDVRASHRVYASLLQLIDASDSTFLARPEVRRKYPAVVKLNLTGPIMTPRVGMDIDVKDYPSVLEPYVAPFKNRIANDEQELNKQVSSLFLFRQFLPEANAAAGFNAAATGNSVSELLSNQLSQYLSQVSENLQVDLDVNGLDQAAINALQLRLSYSLLEGRLRVTREGGFTNVQNQATSSSIAGDWTLEYLLSRDGVFRIKMFHKNNQNVISVGLNNNATTSSGFSLLHTQSFNHVRELWQRKKGEVPDVEPTPPGPTNVGTIIRPQEEPLPEDDNRPGATPQPAKEPETPVTAPATAPATIPDTQ